MNVVFQILSSLGVLISSISSGSRNGVPRGSLVRDGIREIMLYLVKILSREKQIGSNFVRFPVSEDFLYLGLQGNKCSSSSHRD